jgi:hypothetical protein
MISNEKNILKHILLKDFSLFAHYFWNILYPGFGPLQEYQEIICNKISKDDTWNKLVVNIAPAHGKSTLITQLYSTWLLAKNPQTKIFIGTYSNRLVLQQMDAIRTILRSREYHELFGNEVQISSTVDQQTLVKTKTLGYIVGVTPSPKATMTGFQYDIALLDDIQKAQDSTNANELQKCIDWFSGSFASRGLPNSRLINIQQRISPQDLSGYMHQKYRNQKGYQRLVLPVIDENGKPLRKDFSEDHIHSLRMGMDEAEWSSQYMQKPLLQNINRPIERRHFMDLSHISESHDLKHFVVSVDPNSSGKEHADRTGIIVFGLWGPKSGGSWMATIEHIGNIPMDFMNQIKEIDIILKKFGREYPNKIQLLVENKSNGASLIPWYESKIKTFSRDFELKVIPYNPTGNKVTRFANVIPHIQRGLFGFRSKVANLDEFFDQVCDYGCKYDDLKDALSQFLISNQKLFQVQQKRRQICPQMVFY